MFKCKIIKWEEHPEKYRRRSNTWLECIDEDAKIEYFFAEPIHEPSLGIRRKGLEPEGACGPAPHKRNKNNLQFNSEHR